MGLSRPCLLLDLDGATIYGGNPRDGLRGDVTLLHPNLPQLLADSDLDVILLTHRSAAQAATIRSALEGAGYRFRDCVCARDLFYSGLLSLRFGLLLRRGLSKSLALPHLKRRFGAVPADLVLLDDREENLQEMHRAGCARSVLAPFDVQGEGDSRRFQTYEMDAVLAWIKDASATGRFRPEPVYRSATSCPVIAEITAQEPSLLETLRYRINRLRKQLKRKRATS